MSNIKIRNSVKSTIKQFDRVANYSKKLKDNIVDVKNKSNYNNEQTETEYGENKINSTIKNGIDTFNKYGQKSAEKLIDKLKQEQKVDLMKKNIKNSNMFHKNSIKTIKGTTKDTGKGIKTAKNNAKKLKKINKARQKTLQKMKQTANAIKKAIKITIKTVIKAIKAIIRALNWLLILLTGGLWIFVIIIIIICMIGLLVASIFGIFFSSENIGGNTQTKTMSSVVSELNREFVGKIVQIQKDNPYKEYDINSNRADWKDILAVYAVKVNNGDNSTELVTLDENKINTLKEIFWEMNEVNFTKDENRYTKKILHFSYTETVEIVEVTLHININGKNAYEMADKYNFNEEQRKQLEELLKDDYSTAWASVIYGTSAGSNDIVNVAVSQIGNTGGQPYWSWYGFSKREEWCACFVSWCANQCGYIEAGIIPKFASCHSEGVNWFKACNLWRERGYIPKPGDIIFFDWLDETGIRNGIADHVGIVEKIENGKVYTIEGNTSDMCDRREYDLYSENILGYGTPMY